jgi:hypothetical protein
MRWSNEQTGGLPLALKHGGCAACLLSMQGHLEPVSRDRRVRNVPGNRAVCRPPAHCADGCHALPVSKR